MVYSTSKTSNVLIKHGSKMMILYKDQNFNHPNYAIALKYCLIVSSISIFFCSKYSIDIGYHIKKFLAEKKKSLYVPFIFE